ncbi:MAG: hypothetical protein GY769_15005, partial [bacterium]|nr:hypothetical protein [bacterium]
EKLKATIETCLWMMAELEKKNVRLAHLRKALSINTKKTESVLPVGVRRANLLGDCDHGVGARRDAAFAIG